MLEGRVNVGRHWSMMEYAERYVAQDYDDLVRYVMEHWLPDQQLAEESLHDVVVYMYACPEQADFVIHPDPSWTYITEDDIYIDNDGYEWIPHYMYVSVYEYDDDDDDDGYDVE